MNRRAFLASSLAVAGFAGSTPSTAATNARPAVDPLEIQIGASLIRPLYWRWKDQEFDTIPLIASVGLLRWRLKKEAAVNMPRVRIRDNLKLPSNTYQILANGRVVDEGTIAESQLSHPDNHKPVVRRLAAVFWRYQHVVTCDA